MCLARLPACSSPGSSSLPVLVDQPRPGPIAASAARQAEALPPPAEDAAGLCADRDPKRTVRAHRLHGTGRDRQAR